MNAQQTFNPQNNDECGLFVVETLSVGMVETTGFEYLLWVHKKHQNLIERDPL
jgi:hypothetical protein